MPFVIRSVGGSFLRATPTDLEPLAISGIGVNKQKTFIKKMIRPDGLNAITRTAETFTGRATLVLRQVVKTPSATTHFKHFSIGQLWISGIIVYKKTDRAQTSAVMDVFDTTSKPRIKHTSTTNLDLLHVLMNSTSVMVKRGDKYHTKGFALAATFAQVEVFWWHSEGRRTFTRSCACPSERVTLPPGRSFLA